MTSELERSGDTTVEYLLPEMLTVGLHNRIISSLVFSDSKVGIERLGHQCPFFESFDGSVSASEVVTTLDRLAVDDLRPADGDGLGIEQAHGKL